MAKAARLSDKDMREGFGSRLRQLRGKMTQAELAKELGVSASYISAVELGATKPGLDLVLALSERFNVSIKWLLTGKRESTEVGGPVDADAEHFEVMLDVLRQMYHRSDEETRAWMRVQLKRAFPELNEAFSAPKKQQAAAG